ncbi:MAG TPA: hemerythrin domain-containing protein [Capsulimonadaceae bacterium]|jgi:hemerythrin-like domain-containing protein
MPESEQDQLNDFAEPLRLLGDCHRRIERFLGVLIGVVEEHGGIELDGDTRRNFELALRYFHSAIALHTADEEVSLFPRLLSDNSVSARDAVAAIRDLEQEHRTLTRAHDEIERIGRKWINRKAISDEELATLRAILVAVRDTYKSHIAIEDDVIFRVAGDILAPLEIAMIGREMAMRRGLDPDSPASADRCSTRRALRAVLDKQDSALNQEWK